MLGQSVLGAEIKDRVFPGIKSCRKVDEDLEHSTKAGKKVILQGSSGRRERLEGRAEFGYRRSRGESVLNSPSRNLVVKGERNRIPIT